MSDNLRDAATQTIDFETEAPQIQYGDLGGATRGPAVERPSRSVRRQIFWAPIRDRIRRTQENRSGSQTTMTSPDHSGARDAGSQADIARSGIEVNGPQTRSGGQSSHPYPIIQARGPQGPASSIRAGSQSWFNQDHPYQSVEVFHGPRDHHGHHGRGGYQASSLLSNPQHYPFAPHQPPHHFYSSNHHTFQNLQAGARNVPYPPTGPSLEGTIPEIQISQYPDDPARASDMLDVGCQSKADKLAVSTEFDLLNMCPPTPSATGMKELSFEDLGTTIENPEGQAAIPDPASSNSVPRTPSSDWDDETKVSPDPRDGMVAGEVVLGEDDIWKPDQAMMERMKLVKNLLDGNEQYLLPPIRSQTWSPSASSLNLSWPDCDTVVVDEPHELMIKVDASSSSDEVPNVLAKGIESFLTPRSLSAEWV